MNEHPIMIEMRRKWDELFHHVHPTPKMHEFFDHMQKFIEEYSKGWYNKV